MGQEMGDHFTGEFAIGTNPGLTRIVGDFLQDDGRRTMEKGRFLL